MEQFARLLLWLFAAALLVNLVQGGPSQAGAWLRAKFLGGDS